MRKQHKIKIIRNPEIVQAMRGFMPVFANEEDRRIIAKVASYDKILKSVDNESLRAGKNLTPKMKEILKDETALAEWITRRNMDF